MYYVYFILCCRHHTVFRTRKRGAIAHVFVDLSYADL